MLIRKADQENFKKQVSIYEKRALTRVKAFF